MRVIQNTQMHIGEVDISTITLDPKSRDDIPHILRGLQHLYVDQGLRAQLFHLLETDIAPRTDKRTGRPGMTLWSIFVCGVLRLDLNIDYDRLHELVNQHNTIRQMLGHGTFDSFVVETDVHYPTDINLLFDAMRKIIELTARLCAEHGLSDWRQYACNVRHLKRHLRSAQNRKHRKARDPAQQERNDARVIDAHAAYLEAARQYLGKAQATLAAIGAAGASGGLDLAARIEIEGFMQHARRQIDQTRRRVIQGEAIPHAEKVFSVFEPHTERICKGTRSRRL